MQLQWILVNIALNRAVLGVFGFDSSWGFGNEIADTLPLMRVMLNRFDSVHRSVMLQWDVIWILGKLGIFDLFFSIDS